MGHWNRSILVAGAVLAGTLLVGGVAQAQESEWEFVVTPYVFLPAVDVDSTVAGMTVPVDLSFSDIWEDFDAISLSARGEAWQGDWGMILDAIWTDIDGTAGPQGIVGIDIEQWYIDALGGWRHQSVTSGGKPVSCDLTAGLRYNSLKQKITLPPGSVGGTESWVDLMIGGRYIWQFADSWKFLFRGDVGGFGFGDSSDLAASLTSGFAWNFTPAWSLDLGYRYYVLDYNTARSDGAFGVDGSMDGLWLGVTWMQ
jgi:hypothetical protein